MGTLFGGPKAPGLPAAPPPAPLLPDSMGSSASQVSAAQKAAGEFGMDGTILTGPSGSKPASTAGKTLFGQ
jgi:hypothetical protein